MHHLLRTAHSRWSRRLEQREQRQVCGVDPPSIRATTAEAHECRASAVNVASVLQEAARIAFSDPRKLFREDGSLKAITEMDDNTRASIASIEIVENFKTIGGRVVKVEGKADEKSYIKKVKFWDKNSALEKLMKHLSMFTARVEHGKPGKFAHMTEEELQREIVVTARRLGFTISDGRTRAKRSPEKPEES